MIAEIDIHLNSRTFIRNLKPHAYPEGAREGMDWGAKGGIYDSTDPRNIIYWGSPRPIIDDQDFDMQAGETPANCVRRLKIEGYIGLYSARVQADKKRLPSEDKTPKEKGPGSLERIAALVQEKVKRNLTVNRMSGEEGRRPTRTERRDYERQEARNSLISGEVPFVPPLVGVGNGTPDDIDEDEEGDELQEREEEAPRPSQGISSGLDTLVQKGSRKQGSVTLVTPPAPMPEANPQAGSTDLVTLDTDTDETEEESDAPVGGGGRAADNPAPATPATVSPTKGKGLAGRGRRKVKGLTSQE